VRTLLHRTEEEDKAKEVQHIQNALLANGYKRWMFKVPSRPSPTSQENSTSETTRPISVGLPYVSGLSEHLDKECVDVKRKIKEAIHIRRQRPTLNRDGGYDLPAIFDHLLSRD